MLEYNLAVRRSIYALNKSLPISEEKITHLVAQCVLNCPTAFNAQSARVILLFGKSHEAYWQMVHHAIEKISPPERLASALQRIEGFAQAYGTVVFYEDTQTATEMAQKFATYADKMPVWMQHGNAMLQFMVWQCLAENKVGASLQHYGNLVEQEARKQFDLPESWQWVAEMPFGSIGKPADNKTFVPLETRFKIMR
ncbi:MAG: nitroreductase family protein [Alphaproteobacteria bacterium]|nr:nitroreductase family protein [Alphaproteobacteria bacterium]